MSAAAPIARGTLGALPYAAVGEGRPLVSLAGLSPTTGFEGDIAGLPAIRAPALILAGRDDRFYTPELFAETARLIPGSTLRLLDGRGHITVMRDRRLRAGLTEFLAA